MLSIHFHVSIGLLMEEEICNNNSWKERSFSNIIKSNSFTLAVRKSYEQSVTQLTEQTAIKSKTSQDDSVYRKTDDILHQDVIGTKV